MWNCKSRAMIIFKIFVFIIIITNGLVVESSKYIDRLNYENYCGDIAISCVAHCPPFRNQCFASHVADSIRDVAVPIVSDLLTTPLPLLPPNFPIITVSFSFSAFEIFNKSVICEGNPISWTWKLRRWKKEFQILHHNGK
jgi:hypothetical protein